MSAPLLQVRALGKRFGGLTATADLDLEVAAGERVAVIGPNGAGKSTLFNMIGGQLRPDDGEVFFDGAPITGLSPPKRSRLGLGRSFQIAAVFRSMSAVENVATALLAAQGRARALLSPADGAILAEAEEILQLSGLGDKARQSSEWLSYGDVKRLEFAIALAGRPRLLLLDEPTAGMAPAERQSLMAVIRQVTDRQATAVLFTEHDMDVVFDHAERILVMDKGRKLAEGPPEAVRADTAVRAAYLGVEA